MLGFGVARQHSRGVRQYGTSLATVVLRTEQQLTYRPRENRRGRIRAQARAQRRRGFRGISQLHVAFGQEEIEILAALGIRLDRGLERTGSFLVMPGLRLADGYGERRPRLKSETSDTRRTN